MKLQFVGGKKNFWGAEANCFASAGNFSRVCRKAARKALKNSLGILCPPYNFSSSHYTFFALSLLTMFSFPQYSVAQAGGVALDGPTPQNNADYNVQAENALYAVSPIALPASSNAVRIVSSHDRSGQMWIVITAYSSTKDQTDGNPFITASGSHVRDGIIAANFLPFGTKVRFPTLYGDKIFVVEDRMAGRYHYHADIWMATYENAKTFGVQIAPMEIVSS